MKNDFMIEALKEALISSKINEVPVGAVVVRNNEIIGRGHNNRKENNLVISHAEINAIIDAQKNIGSYYLNDCEIYVTLEPCPMCAYAIIDSHIKTLVYGANDEKRGAISTLDIFNKNLGSKVDVYGNILSEESSKLLKDFFKKLR